MSNETMNKNYSNSFDKYLKNALESIKENKYLIDAIKTNPELLNTFPNNTINIKD